MRLLIGVIQGKFITYYFWGPLTKGRSLGHRGRHRDTVSKETRLELDLTLEQPDVKENLAFWNKTAEKKKWYALLILIDNNKGTKDYAPIETKEIFDKLLSLGRIEK